MDWTRCGRTHQLADSYAAGYTSTVDYTLRVAAICAVCAGQLQARHPTG